MKHYFKIALPFLGVLLVTACSNRAVYTEESFAEDSPFKRKFEREVAPVCESARRSLLGQGYLIESANSDGIKARKAIKREDNPNTFIEMNIACLPEANGSTLFATGLLSTYALKKSSSSASVGLSALGSISLPIGQSADSLVKVSEETIDDKDFYKRFFNAVGSILGEMPIGKTPAAPEPPPLEQPAAEATGPEAVPEEPAPAVAQPSAVIIPQQVPEEPAPASDATSDAPETSAEQPPAPVSGPSEWHYDE